MEKVSFATEMGKKIIESQHKYFATGNSEDILHITNIKRIIMAISEYLRSLDVPEDEISSVAEKLRELTKGLFLDSCMANIKEGEDPKEREDDSITWFDYIYENEEYPR
ncbi:hypothetical protein ACFL0M_00925 [Thermodesulfobacteriota bacterium]